MPILIGGLGPPPKRGDMNGYDRTPYVRTWFFTVNPHTHTHTHAPNFNSERKDNFMKALSECVEDQTLILTSDTALLSENKE